MRSVWQKTRPTLGGGVVLGCCVLWGVLLAAEATIKIEIAEGQHGAAVE